ncbi:hypothetical protein, partial [Pseudomonas huaxiensis]|uniref:hypothetical protein n=1 Tax=Pseudomonas huaxiensis TaxID=2213017 RepID=UPI001CDD1D95
SHYPSYSNANPLQRPMGSGTRFAHLKCVATGGFPQFSAETKKGPEGPFLFGYKVLFRTL